jgi:ATP:corrinoid adenosyltransferase
MLTPAFQPRRAVTVKWGSLPGHSCGTAPDSHRRSLRCAAHHSQRRLGALGPTLRLVARGESIVLLNTGHGKGKSSAAFGVMARGWARGWRVGVVQFVKGGKWKTGERKLADHLGVEWHTLGDGFTWESTDLDEPARMGRGGGQARVG